MTKEELALKLNGMEYGTNISEELIKEANENGLVIVYGYSDDLIELEGAITDEGDCDDGGKFLIVKAGETIKGYDEDEGKDVNITLYEYGIVPIDEDSNTTKNVIEAVWFSEDNDPVIAWTYKTEIPHAKFEVIETDDEESEVQCIGLVFHIDDLK